LALTATSIHTMAEGILACVCAALDELPATVEGHPGCPCNTCLVPGQPAWDWCAADCGTTCPGELYVGMRRLYPSRDSPRPFTEVRTGHSCPPLLTAAEFTITLARCAPVADDNGIPPSCDDLAESARILHADAAGIANALHCCVPGLAADGRRLRYLVGEQRVIGPQGRCVGLEQIVTVALGGCACPSEGANP